MTEEFTGRTSKLWHSAAIHGEGYGRPLSSSELVMVGAAAAGAAHDDDGDD